MRQSGRLRRRGVRFDPRGPFEIASRPFAILSEQTFRNSLTLCALCMRRGVIVGCADEKPREEGAGFGSSGRRTAARSQASIGAGQKRLTSVGARPHKPSQIGRPGERSNRGDTRDLDLSRSIGGERSRLSACVKAMQESVNPAESRTVITSDPGDGAAIVEAVRQPPED
jgi:hypothetical protein